MSVSVMLRTNDPDCELQFDFGEFDKAGPALVGNCLLHVRAFRAELPLWWHVDNVRQLIRKLGEIGKNLTGEVRLDPGGDFNSIALRVLPTGAVMIEAALGFPESDYLKVVFRTDQTCLAPLAADLDDVLQRLVP